MMIDFLTPVLNRLTKLNTMWRYILSAVFVMVALTVFLTKDKNMYVTLQGQTMGTTWLVKIV